MLTDRRTFRRSDIFRVIQFRPLHTSNEYALGITRDLSPEGLGFESQAVDLEPGEELEVILKLPESTTSVSCEGEVVWKRSSSKFRTFAGIMLREISNANKRDLLDLISTTEDIPLVPSYPGGNNGGTYGNHPASEERQATETDTPSGLKETLYERSADVDHPGDDIHIANESAEAREEKAKAPGRNRAAIIALLVIAALGSIIYTLLNKDSGKMDAINPPAVSQEASRQSGDRTGLPMHDASDTKKMTSGYLVQAGAWKNPDYASEMLIKLRKYYPDAYIEKRANFHVIRISGIMTQQQGNSIARDIESKLGLRPMLVRQDQ